ncbi:MAG: glutamate-5-semialdehyde dehydrogenase [Verrucomicrobia bacterium]|nr:glutamate-5-semialdehyde dehydrogenase [Verrucomicrobiota bacterium]MBV8484960.1 glutamate-5-semialdehyde dehydrogenase [Verrucomicrobiota bacterium]
MSDIREQLLSTGARARKAAKELATRSEQQKSATLIAAAEQIEKTEPEILAANQSDLQQGAANGLSSALLDRLKLDHGRLAAICRSLREVARLPDPVGQVIKEWSRPDGLRFKKVRVPIGVIGIIFESRPNVTSDAASLCLKTGNAVILRGGSEALASNIALGEALRAGCRHAGIPEDAVQVVSSVDRSAVRAMSEMAEFIDLIIPRGGKQLIETVTAFARMPVIKHFDGICHVYVDQAADLDMAQSIVINAKCQRPSVCNAAETLLVHAGIAEEFLKRCGPELQHRGVELRGDAETQAILGSGVRPATDQDWRTEHLDLILSVRVVPTAADAIAHIETYGSHHSDSIVTNDEQAANEFLNKVDSAAVFWNASTRFNDGGEFGFGAEIGISTDRLHARGPMALEELTIYKYQVIGQGHVKA